jgi:hypothetical protein
MKVPLLILSGTFAIISCHENKEDDFEKIVAYPTTVGNEWTYNIEAVSEIFESVNSDKIVDRDTLIFTARINVEKDTILYDTMNVVKFVSVIDVINETSEQYFYTDAEGLKVYAYSNHGSHAFVKKSGVKNQLTDMLTFGFFEPLLSEENDIIVIEPSPRLNLKFPLEINSKWIYVHPFEPMNLQIDKKVLGYERVKINNRSFDCCKVEWIYIENVFFDNMKIYDWISNEGLIKRLVIYERALFNDEENGLIGSFQLTETILLKDLNLIAN